MLVRALTAIEHARCRSLRYSLKMGDPNEALHAEELDANALPADWADQGLAKARASLQELTGLTLPAGHRAAWPVTLSPQEFLPELVAHLKTIEQMLAYLQAQGAVRRQRAAGVSEAQVAAMLAALPEVGYDPAHTAGLERQAYLQHLQALKAECGA